MKNVPAHSPQLWAVPSGPDALFAVNSEDDVIVQLSLSPNAYGQSYLGPLRGARVGKLHHASSV